MTNMKLLAQCYTDVLNSMADYTASLEADTKLEALEEDMAVVEKLSVILKRIGETQVIELVEQVASAASKSFDEIALLVSQAMRASIE